MFAFGEAGCFQKGVHSKEVWVRVVGLPLHLWRWEVFCFES